MFSIISKKLLSAATPGVNIAFLAASTNSVEYSPGFALDIFLICACSTSSPFSADSNKLIFGLTNLATV
jgi:hypothetical protein